VVDIGFSNRGVEGLGALEAKEVKDYALFASGTLRGGLFARF